MLPSLFANAAEAVAEIHDSPLEKIQSTFGIEGGYLAMQLVSFAVLAVVLYKWVLAPTLATMDERNKKIEEGLRYAKDMEAKLAAAQNDAAEKLKQASIEAGKIVNEARGLAKDIENRAQSEAQKRAEELVTKAKQAIELDRQKAMAEARAEITRLVVATTEKVLRTQLNDADRARYNSAAAKELAGV